MSVIIITLAIAAGCVLFLAGFYTGIWIQRHSITTVEVPKIVETEKVVPYEVPRLIEVPMPQQKKGPSLAVIGQNQGTRDVLTPAQKDENQRMQSLLGGNPEYGGQ